MSNDVDRLVQQVVGWIASASRRAARYATIILVAVLLAVGFGFWLGLAALSGGIRTVWIFIAGAFGILAIGGALVALWRVVSIRRHVPAIESEVRTILSKANDRSRTVIETIVVDRNGDGNYDRPDGSSARVISRQITQMRDVIGPGMETSGRVTAVMTAITSYPILLGMAALIAFVFACFGFVFLLALAIG